MQIVIRSGVVAGWHPDGQDLSGVAAYRDCLILTAPDATPVEIGQTWEVDLEAAKASRIAQATAACSAVLAPLSVRYCPYERDTWTEQVAQAQALLADPTLETPPANENDLDPVSILRSITAYSGESMPALAMAILKNRERWLVVSGIAIGQRQAIENKVKACATVADVLAVDMTITLPG